MATLPPIHILREQMATGDRCFHDRQYQAARERYAYVADTLNAYASENAGKAGKVGMAAGAIAGFLIPFGHLITVPLGAWLGNKIGKEQAEASFGNSEYVDVFLRAIERVRECEKLLGYRR